MSQGDTTGLVDAAQVGTVEYDIVEAGPEELVVLIVDRHRGGGIQRAGHVEDTVVVA